MASKPARPAPSDNPITANGVYTLAQGLRRLNWGRKTFWEAEKAGLRSVQFGRQKFLLGADILRFFEGLANEAEGGPQ